MADLNLAEVYSEMTDSELLLEKDRVASNIGDSASDVYSKIHATVIQSLDSEIAKRGISQKERMPEPLLTEKDGIRLMILLLSIRTSTVDHLSYPQKEYDLNFLSASYLAHPVLDLKGNVERWSLSEYASDLCYREGVKLKDFFICRHPERRSK